VIRAAVMGALVVMAQESGRIFDVRNAIMLAGFLMVLYNPKILVFDIGFQLSFLALLGIVYLKPALQKLSRMKESPGFLSWRDNLLTTEHAAREYARCFCNETGNWNEQELNKRRAEGKALLGDMSQFSRDDLRLSIDGFAMKHLLPMVRRRLRHRDGLL